MAEPDRYQLHDTASVYHRPWFDRLRTWWRLRDRRIRHGAHCSVKRNVDIRLCDNAILELGDHVIIERYAFLQLTKPAPHLTIGKHSSIGRGTIIAVKGRVTIGDYTMLGPNCQINDQDHGFKAGELIMNQRAVIAPVTIGSDCWFGSGVRVVKGVTIGDGAVIGAGSVVVCDVPTNQIWAGVPARFIKERE